MSRANSSSRLKPAIPAMGGAFRKVRPDLIVVGLLALLCLLLFWRLITPNPADRGSFPPGDFTDQFYSFGVYEAGRLLRGHWPLWSPYTYSGHPFLADIQSAIFYPISLLTILISAPVGFSVLALEVEAVFHFFLASLFTYCFAKRLLHNRYAALTSALVFAYGGYLTSYPSQQLAILEVDVWLPLILLLLDIGWERWPEGGNLHFVGAGLIFGIAILAGHPQSAMYVLYVSLIYSLFKAHCCGVGLSQSLGVVFLFLLLGFGLAAVQLVPSLEFMRLSTRAQSSYQELSSGLPFQDVLHLILPSSAFVVSAWNSTYIGIFPLLLVLMAVFLRRERETIFWGLLALGAWLLSFGGNTFFYVPFYLLVPGFGLFRSQERAIYVFNFAMAVLSGYGATLLGKAMPKSLKGRFRSFCRFVFYSWLGALLLAALCYHGWLGDDLDHGSAYRFLLDRVAFLAVLLLFSLAMFLVRLRRLLQERWLMILVLTLIVFDLFTVNWRNNFAQIKPEEHDRPGPLIELLQQDEGTFRVYNEWRLPGNYGLLYGVEDIWGSSPLRLRRYDQFVSQLPEGRVWELLNVKYVVTWRQELAQKAKLLYQEPVGEETAYLHRLADLAPRAYIVHQAQVVRDEEEMLSLLGASDFDPQQVVILEEEPGLKLPQAMIEGSRVRVVERESERMLLEADLADNGLLVLSEVHYPGWRAYVDRQEAKVHLADYVLRGVALKKGKHRVELIYDPLSLKVGALLSLITLLASFVYFVIGALRLR